MGGPVVKNTLVQKKKKRQGKTVQHGKVSTDRRVRFINRTSQLDYEFFSNIGTAGFNRRFYDKSSDHTTSKYTQSSTGVFHDSTEPETKMKMRNAKKYRAIFHLNCRISKSSFSTSCPQDSSRTSRSPASLRNDDAYQQAPGNRRDDPKTKIKMRTTNKQRETTCETSRSGSKSSQIISKIQKCLHPQTLLMTQIQYSYSLLPTTEIAQHASEPRLQEPFAEGEMAMQYFGQKM